jgi:hypothetical protein
MDHLLNMSWPQEEDATNTLVENCQQPTLTVIRGQSQGCGPEGMRYYKTTQVCYFDLEERDLVFQPMRTNMPRLCSCSQSLE